MITQDQLKAALDNAKLTPEVAAEIRRRYVPRICTLTMLADEYGVNHKTIHSIISGKTWRESK
jgi:hypothetical protein